MTLVQVAKVVQLGKVLTVLGCLLWGNLISNASPPPHLAFLIAFELTIVESTFRVSVNWVSTRTKD